MLLTVAAALRKTQPDIKIVVWLRKADFAEARAHGFEPRERLIGPPVAGGLVQKLTRKIHTFRTGVTSRMLIDVGGYQFGDPWGSAASFRKVARNLRVMRTLGVPTFYLPQAWGPFEKPGMPAAISAVINNSEVSYVRDRASLNAVVKILGPDHHKISLAPDVAWNFKPAPLEAVEKVCARYPAPAGRPTFRICLTPNLRVYERSPGAGRDNEYVQFLIRLTDAMITTFDASVLLLGHELQREEKDQRDDRFLTRLVAAAFPGNPRVLHVDEYLPAAVIKALVGQCEFVISSRFHCLIAALSQCVPAAAIGWSHKYDELLADVGLPENLLVATEEWPAVWSRLREIIGRRAIQAAHLQQVVPEIRRRAAVPLAHLASRLQKDKDVVAEAPVLP